MSRLSIFLPNINIAIIKCYISNRICNADSNNFIEELWIFMKYDPIKLEGGPKVLFDILNRMWPCASPFKPVHKNCFNASMVVFIFICRQLHKRKSVYA